MYQVCFCRFSMYSREAVSMIDTASSDTKQSFASLTDTIGQGCLDVCIFYEITVLPAYSLLVYRLKLSDVQYIHHPAAPID